MDKFAKLSKKIFLLIYDTKRQEINNLKIKNFNRFKKFVIDNRDNFIDDIFPTIIKQYTEWFEPELRDIRDDFIQHEFSFKIWGSSLNSRKSEISFSFSKFKPFHTPPKIHKLIERNKDRFPQIVECYSILQIITIFDEHWNELNQEDRSLVTSIKQSFGGEIPDIIKLYTKMSIFFTKINDYFVRKIEEE
jgi:hypothetical protein